MKIKSNISDLAISVNARDLAKILALATQYDALVTELQFTQQKVVRMREELARDHQHFIREKAKKISGASASGEPQPNETNAGAKADAVSLTIETEGRVSGGDRAVNENEATK